MKFVDALNQSTGSEFELFAEEVYDLMSGNTGEANASQTFATTGHAQEESEHSDLATTIIKGIAFSTPILLTLCGNTLVLIAIATNKSLQRPCNVFLASLAVADLGVGSMVMVPSAVDEMLGWWPFGPFCCQLYNALDVTCCTVSILHLCAVSIDRYYAIVKEPLLYQSSVTKWRTLCLLILVWIMGLFIGFVSVFSGIYTTESVLHEIYGNPKVCMFEVNKVYSVVAGGISFWIPAFLMIYIYIRVYMEAVKLELSHGTTTIGAIEGGSRIALPEVSTAQVRPAGHAESSPDDHNGINVQLQTSSSLNPFPPNLNTRTRRSMDKRLEVKAAISLSFIMGGFMICWLPFFIWMPLVHLMEIETPHNLYLYILWIGYLNSGINPVIYGFHHQEFKAVFRGYFRKLECLKKLRCCKRSAASNPQPDIVLQIPSHAQSKWV